MAKYDRLALRAKLELRLQAVYDDAAQSTAQNEARFDDYKAGRVAACEKAVKDAERMLEEAKGIVFGGDTVKSDTYERPRPVFPNADSIRDIQRALDELDILVGDEITLKSTAMLKLL